MELSVLLAQVVEPVKLTSLFYCVWLSFAVSEVLSGRLVYCYLG